MGACSLLTCLMMLMQSNQTNSTAHEDVVGHLPSYDLSWMLADRRKSSVQIHGPVWTRGVSVWHSGMTTVWATPGHGRGIGVGVSVDY